jgi:hypothetical protein
MNIFRNDVNADHRIGLAGGSLGLEEEDASVGCRLTLM